MTEPRRPEDTGQDTAGAPTAAPTPMEGQSPPVETIGADTVQPASPSPASSSMPTPAETAASAEDPSPTAAVPASEPAAAAASGLATDAPQNAGSAPAEQAVVVATPPSSGAAPRAQGMSPELAAHLTLPNILTGLRVVLVLFIVILLLWPWGPQLTGALILFGIAAATDWLDGRLARAWNQESDLGRMLDHIADKLLVGLTMLCLCAVGVIDGVNALAAALILGRELAVSGLREHLSAKGMVVPSSVFAKWKTTFQMVALAALMAAPLAPLSGVARVAGLLILWVALAMTLISGAQYVWASRDAWKKT